MKASSIGGFSSFPNGFVDKVEAVTLEDFGGNF